MTAGRIANQLRSTKVHQNPAKSNIKTNQSAQPKSNNRTKPTKPTKFSSSPLNPPIEPAATSGAVFEALARLQAERASQASIWQWIPTRTSGHQKTGY
jgi:hypothetical protein